MTQRTTNSQRSYVGFKDEMVRRNEIAMRLFELRGHPSRSLESRRIWQEILELKGQ